MKYIDEYRDRARVAKLAAALGALTPKDRAFTFMEVCGTHTMAVARFGLKKLLPPNVNLISGPGCPVCVTPKEYIDHAAALARTPGVTVATFGDMMRVPGSSTDFLRLQAEGADVRVVYSPLEAVALAADKPDRKVVFLGVGFETTAPTVAAAIKRASALGLGNFHVLAAHKLVPPALRALAANAELTLDGFLLPAHVSAVIGAAAYGFLPRDFGLGGAVAGFEPVDIMQGIYLLVKQRVAGAPRVDNGYSRVVRPGGNAVARVLLAEVFEGCDAAWRGLGVIPASGLKLTGKYSSFDAARAIPVAPEETTADEGCLCGAILTGVKAPADCPLFGAACTPATPVGPCMVSSEGTCAAAFNYDA